MLIPALTGFSTSAAFILAIGPQNTFILRQGLARSHVFWLCLFCAVSDAILITAGVAGFGVIVGLFPSLPVIMTWGGAAFLFVYGVMRFYAAWINKYEVEIAGKSVGLWAAIMTCAAFTWLNPHVYLDTLVLLGAISTEFPEPSQKIAFALGAILPSFLFFFSLGYGARLLAPVMQSAQAWRVLDVLIGVLMWGLAAKLLS
ncbi:LysE/ArgO family amino acid transporter [Yoonia sp. F2084L]|uniref:LysE/ArgO family amino acid transporter n=1 Tax=Yoonia sp. F2084L TaxID=2926419 RepID=UPI001FF4B631|nr:LysE/ArgO family amino acid transporter [Yoonia sp. F2084L]MCK0094503.1 LysE/ArgO family amino acid transporter [Yoonia sp. F2084L]